MRRTVSLIDMTQRIGDFLNDVMDAFSRRGKAIRYHGRLVVHEHVEEAPHWVAFAFTPQIGASILFEVSADNVARLTIQSTRRKDRGKTLLSVDGLVLTPRAEEIVAAFERTISHVHWLGAEHDLSVIQEIRDCWAGID
jgi:hypothetical protein